MKKYSILGFCCLAVIFSATNLYAQQGGFTGPAVFSPFTGPSRIVSVAQASTFQDKAPVILVGNIVQIIGSDRFLFRDSSGEMIIRIRQNRWFGIGSPIDASDRVEIMGEVK